MIDPPIDETGHKGTFEDMTPEETYDFFIAPKLAEIARLCTDNEMSLVAAVEFRSDGIDKIAETTMVANDFTFAIQLVAFAVRAKGNVDALALSCYRWAKKHGGIDSSIVLHRIDKSSKP